MTGITAYSLRYYEKKGLIHVERDIKKYSDLRYQGEATMEERMGLLVQHRESVLEEQQKRREYLENLDEKIEYYKEKCLNN